VRANNPKPIPCTTLDRFGTDAQGKRIALVSLWHAPDLSQFECFDMPGWHPTRGVRLLEITDELATKLDTWLNTPTPTPDPTPTPEPTIEVTVSPTPEQAPTPTPEPTPLSTPAYTPTPDTTIQHWATPRPKAPPTPHEVPALQDVEPQPTPPPTPTTPPGRMVPAGTMIRLKVTRDIDLIDVLPRPISPIETKLVDTLVDSSNNEIIRKDRVFEIGAREHNQIREKVVRVWFGIYDTLNPKDEKRNFRIVPINHRLTFPETVDMAKSVSKTVGGGHATNLIIEEVGYQKALIDDLKMQGYPAEGIKAHGQDKTARLALTTHLLQSGQILFPEKGCEALIQQLIGFGREKHDDLADAFAYLILWIIKNNTPEPGIIVIKMDSIFDWEGLGQRHRPLSWDMKF
jgi:predicted phage terminase large subunit-like protein